MPPSAVLVTGATGNQGGAVAEELLRSGRKVRAFVRQVRSRRARQLAALGAELAEGDYDDPASLVAAATGMQGMFALGTPFEAGVEGEVLDGAALIRAAKKAGVEHFVYSSVAGADRHTGIPHFESKHLIEEQLKKSGLAYTIVAPVHFRENHLGSVDEMVAIGVFSMPLAADKRLQSLCREDLGAFVAHVFAAGSSLFGRRIELASDESTGPEMARSFARALGRPIRYVPSGVEEVLSSDNGMNRMWAWFNRAGYSADIGYLRREFPDVPWKTFDEWARGLAEEVRDQGSPDLLIS
jgi:uncharacterized protein YbjT (DUF2867 family)